MRPRGFRKETSERETVRVAAERNKADAVRRPVGS